MTFMRAECECHDADLRRAEGDACATRSPSAVCWPELEPEEGRYDFKGIERSWGFELAPFEQTVGHFFLN